MGDVVDLTSDNEEESLPIVPLQTIPRPLRPFHPHPPHPPPTHPSAVVPRPALPLTGPPPRSALTLTAAPLVRTTLYVPLGSLPSSSSFPNSASPYSDSSFAAAISPPIRRPPTVISFSLLSTREFTAKANGILSKEVVTTLRLAPGVKFDRELMKWIFPIEIHDRLHVALSVPSLSVTVEPLPRSTLAAALLHQQRQTLRKNPDLQRSRILQGINNLNPETILQSDQIEDVLPPRLFEALAPFQREGVEFVVKNDGKAIIADEMGLGKAQPYTSKILTPGGWKHLGEICVGSSVIGRSGLPTIVTGVYPRGVRQIMSVTFNDGAVVECCDEHLWRVQIGDNWKTLSTAEIAHYLYLHKNLVQINIPLVSPVVYSCNSTKVPHDPYTLGVVIGISQVSQKNECLVDIGLNSFEELTHYHQQLKGVKGEVVFLDSHSVLRINCQNILSLLNLPNVSKVSLDNWIRKSLDFLVNSSVTERTSLLRGICDSLLWTEKEKSSVEPLYFPQLSSDLAKLLLNITQSLGGIILQVDAHLEMKTSICPFTIPSKARRFQASEDYYRPTRHITSIEPSRQDHTLCISVSASDHLYVTDHFVVTHNTIQAIASACMYSREWPTLVFTPSSARYHWKAEILKWLAPEVVVESDVLVVDTIAGGTSIPSTPHKFLILSYSLISKIQDILASSPHKVIIADESHYIKNSLAQRTKIIVPILQSAPRVIMLTGTPAISRPYELFSQLNALAPRSWSNEQEFVKRYCSGGKKRAYGPDNQGASHTEELRAILFGTIMIGRLKKDILRQLPPKRRHIVLVPVKDEITSSHLSDLLNLIKLNEEYKSHGSKPKRTERFVSLSEINPSQLLPEESAPVPTRKSLLLQLFTESGMAKISGVLDHLTAFLDDAMSGKIIIFAHHRMVLDYICTFLKQREADYVRIDGNTQSKDRQNNIDKFQNLSTCRVAVLSITSAGIAITLTAASTVYFAELFWTPASLLQAEDRAHRIGQTAEVQIYYFRAEGTIDDILWPMLVHKIKTLGEVFEGVKVLDLEGENNPNSLQSTEIEELAKAEGVVTELNDRELLEECEDETEELEHPMKRSKTIEPEPSLPPPPSFASSALPMTTSPLTIQPSVESISGDESLDQRRLIRKARIRLLREQQRLNQVRPSDPQTISLIEIDCDPEPDPIPPGESDLQPDFLGL